MKYLVTKHIQDGGLDTSFPPTHYPQARSGRQAIRQHLRQAHRASRAPWGECWIGQGTGYMVLKRGA